MVREDLTNENGILYRDRHDAGGALADRLGGYADPTTLVLGIPRGGVIVAAEVARALGAPLDVVVSRKLGAPHAMALAIGAVTANRGRYLDEPLIKQLGIGRGYIEVVTAEERLEARRQEAEYREERPHHHIGGRTVILVDDGVVTGATMEAAVRAVRWHRPARLVVAVPVAARDACARLRAEVDDLVCPAEQDVVEAVSLFYHAFPPVSDAGVRAALREAARGESTAA